MSFVMIERLIPRPLSLVSRWGQAPLLASTLLYLRQIGFSSTGLGHAMVLANHKDGAPFYCRIRYWLVSSFWRPALGPWLVATTVTGACKVKFITVSDGSLMRWPLLAA
jgi:hypothetical protein